MAVEETRRRNEASMARKRAANTANSAVVNGSLSPDGPISPVGTGAMDSLLEKLRAAAPQARDQRDRRRRARLKDKHQIRVASGQKMPDMAELAGVPDRDDSKERKEAPALSTVGEDAEKEPKDVLSEGEDIADRAASILQGLMGDGDVKSNVVSKDGSLRIRRRRESADDERRNRRRRRAANNSSTSTNTDGEGTPTESSFVFDEPLPEEAQGEGESRPGSSKGASEKSTPQLVATATSSPTPEQEGTAQRPVEILD